ncbi:uncharacterized protein At4g08330, chloroplastic [Brassica rapa]|uniref:BnaA02g36660D protein n=3 Tax=Brassica TaxID=3705 RepID=A0A078JNJ6_BRANA|nr:uncharacterized protein At4g08330, chloroplastic [Brassica rapa]XP_013725721.1 uncharacterized protein At4g08330, chloroplastic-like [Brassica napus]KAH0939085.1 hypothetical protein HID58_006546 [Brassica napus]CAF2141756.1 unnamed protein product [Brassica napus]CAG7894396.1 unnamed protein product [Brassica rapa]CDY69123.1 BnaA02g36660D [Brassica napus]VDC90190.1 unnamed protein product [Brassica rapa]
MDRSASVGIKDGGFGGNHLYSPSFSSSSSMRHVNYSCGSCGYELNLSSTNRITSSIGSKYGKSMKTGIISFFNIDEGRFSQVDEFQCMPHFSRYSWGLFRRKTKLLCRQCNNYIGNASYDKAPPEYALVTQNSSPRKGVTDTVTKYDIRIRALQPSSGVASL